MPTQAGLGQLCEPHEVGIEKSCMSYVIVAHRVPERSEAMRRHELGNNHITNALFFLFPPNEVHIIDNPTFLLVAVHDFVIMHG